jgi:hypothetical protein
MKNKASSIVNNRLKAHKKILTPVGFVNSRPMACQWCLGIKDTRINRIGREYSNKISHIHGHHFLGYNSECSRRTVIFLCRRCHCAFESDTKKLGLIDIINRFGIFWLELFGEVGN